MQKPTYKFGNRSGGVGEARTLPFVVAGGILERDGKILLVKESQPGRADDGKWSQPCGHVDIGESPIEAAKREVLEETGMKFTPTHLLGVCSLVRKDIAKGCGWTPHALKFIFTGTFKKRPGAKLSGDIKETRWFTPAEIEKMDRSMLRDMDIKRMVRNYFSGKRYPLEIISHMVQ